jgi:hypothetical protein
MGKISREKKWRLAHGGASKPESVGGGRNGTGDPVGQGMPNERQQFQICFVS